MSEKDVHLNAWQKYKTLSPEVQEEVIELQKLEETMNEHELARVQLNHAVTKFNNAKKSLEKLQCQAQKKQ